MRKGGFVVDKMWLCKGVALGCVRYLLSELSGFIRWFIRYVGGIRWHLQTQIAIRLT